MSVVGPSYSDLQAQLEVLLAALYPNGPVTPAQSDSLFSHSIHLLSALNNPLNLELLTSHILQSPAVWIVDTNPIKRYTRILAGFRAALGWKVSDIEEGKGGINIDEWILAVGRGASGSTPAWRHLLLFAGLRSAILEEGTVKTKTKHALEHAYLRAFLQGTTSMDKDITEGTLYSLALMEHIAPPLVDQLITSGKAELLLFLVEGMFSPMIGFFSNLPHALASTQNRDNSMQLIQDFDSHVLQPHISRISHIIATAASRVNDVSCLSVILDTIQAITSCIHQSFSGLPANIAQNLLNNDPSHSARDDIIPVLWENLQKLLFSTVMSLQGIISNILFCPPRKTDYALLAEKSLTILGNLAFISSKFGYSAFDEWNFIYLSNIDILSRYPLKASHFISQNPPHKLPEHPTQRADSLFYLDTLEQFIPVLPTQEIQKVLGTVYLSLDCVSEISLRAHLEAAHSVFLAILGRGDILHDQIISYLDRVYTAFPSALTARQFRLAFSTVVKLSSPAQSNVVLTNLLQHALRAHATPLPNLGKDRNQPSDDQSTYFFALIDCLPWIETGQVEFWLDQVWNAVKSVKGGRREGIVRRVWECVSAEMGGDGGISAVEWWINRPQLSTL